ncbi:monovalent cation/H+ antiporter complex subunit F [Salinibacterium hongtaonis]|uniref:Sodium:proton antiporter n=1 Tax=Homoserinimonas hongtaonis TaxID=2079791 RepID=A0A2U1SWZ5_9MICO|nr:monovalent cation/H+ antiporter complex subunit F [Salinibacterium hongtaonis]AWB88702.1 sodium:proton antiporter [Salinibacterium hongtaonis]PWB96112.1 sodium:proton antiporter [Salinibacterium hongtaonis]
MIPIVYGIVGLLFVFAAAASVYRIVRGPAILDRMIASDMLVTTIMCVLGVDMVVNDHVRFIPIMLVLALIAVFASMTVARYVSKQSAEDRPSHQSPVARGRNS